MANRIPFCLRLALVLLVGPGAMAQTAAPVAPATRRAVVPRYVVKQRVEVLRGEEWWPATVIAVEKEKYRLRTDANEEMLVVPLEIRRYTRARSYPIKAAPEDVAAIHPPPETVAPLRPGIQPAEPEPAGEPKAAEPEPVVEKPAAPGIPLPPAPNALPNDLPPGDLSTATSLASPEKVTSRIPFQADPFAPPAHPLAAGVIPLRPLDTRDAVFETPAGLFFTAPEYGQVFVPHHERSPDAASDLYYDRYELSTDRRTGGFAVPAGGRVLDLSPDGTRLLLCWTSADSVDNVRYDCLGIFVVLDDRLTLRAAWRPYVATRAQTTQAGVDTGHFLDATHVVTSAGSDLTCWDADTLHAKYRLYPISPCKPAVSPSRKYVVVAVGTSAWILDAATGQPAIKLPGTLPAAGAFSFQPEAKQVGLLTEDRLLVWNLRPDGGAAAGDPDSDTALMLPDSAPATTLDWLSEGYALVNRRYCVDIARQILLWDYAGEPDGVGGACAGQYWYSVPSANQGRVLAHLPLPHEAAIREAARIDPATVMAVHPGAKVAIDLSRVDAPDPLKARAVAALTTKVQANRMEVADNQPLRLVVSSAPGEMREITYRTASTGDAVTVQVPEDRVTVAFVVGDRVAWQTTRPATVPGTLAMRPGQSVEDFLAGERGRLRLAAAAAVTLAKYVPHPRKELFYGRSVLTDGDPRPADGSGANTK